MYKGTKITLRAKLYKDKQKAGQKVVNSRCRGVVLRNSQVAKICNLRRNLQVATFCNSANFPLPSSSAFLLQISSGSIMHLRIRLGFIVFESD